MERLRREALVFRDFISFRESEDSAGELVAVHILGVVSCSEEVLIRVDKKMLVRRDDQNRYEVRTQFYQYHAMMAGRAGRPRRNLVRFDNAHGEGLHRHAFDASGVETAMRFIELEEMPTLDEFIRLAIPMAPGEPG